MKQLLLGLFALLTLIVAPACAVLPGASDFGEDLVSPHQLATSQKLNPEIVKQIDALELTKEQRRLALTMAHVQRAVGIQPFSKGNQVTLLNDGPETHRAQLAAIRAAKSHVFLEVYIFTDDVIGQQYAEALAERAEAGVDVRLIYDSVGGLGALPPFIWNMQQAGVHVQQFHSLNPFKDIRIWQWNRRSHRKVLVVDGLIAFTGGINIMDTYVAGPNGDEPGWRDIHMAVVGPVAKALQASFVSIWNKTSTFNDVSHPPIPALSDQAACLDGAESHDQLLVGVVTNKGTDLIRALLDQGESTMYKMVGDERDTRHGIYQTYLMAIRNATKSIWVTQAYFVPDKKIQKGLIKAAKRGVDVHLLLPGIGDSELVSNASRAYYGELLEAGVKVSEYQGAMMHAKAAVVDGVWATVGSSNLDYRSLLHNEESNAVVIGRSFAEQMERVFEADLERSKTIVLEEWDQRPFSDKTKQWWASWTRYWI
jgi:cardiolipin synthase